MPLFESFFERTIRVLNAKLHAIVESDYRIKSSSRLPDQQYKTRVQDFERKCEELQEEIDKRLNIVNKELKIESEDDEKIRKALAGTQRRLLEAQKALADIQTNHSNLNNSELLTKEDQLKEAIYRITEEVFKAKKALSKAIEDHKFLMLNQAQLEK